MVTEFDIHGQWTEFLDRNRIVKRQIDCFWFSFSRNFDLLEHNDIDRHE